MSGWEYKVVPAPKKGVKAAGVKGPEGRFANALEALMNEMGTQGWEYQRAETLPSLERSGLTGNTTEWRNLLVFRRVVAVPLDDFEPQLLPPPTPEMMPDPVQDAARPSDAENQTAHNVTPGDQDSVPDDGETPENGPEDDRVVDGTTKS